jgi:hypothetical protein
VSGLTPHPTSDPLGHSFGRHEPPAVPLDESSYSNNAAYVYAIDLFNHGFYWEAHEAWEALWHAAGCAGPTADFLKGLIKLAAAGVKAREGRAEGARRHAARAGELLRSVATSETGCKGLFFGLPLADLVAAASGVETDAQGLASTAAPDAGRSLPLVLRLDEAGSR